MLSAQAAFSRCFISSVIRVVPVKLFNYSWNSPLLWKQMFVTVLTRSQHFYSLQGQKNSTNIAVSCFYSLLSCSPIHTCDFNASLFCKWSDQNVSFYSLLLQLVLTSLLCVLSFPLKTRKQFPLFRPIFHILMELPVALQQFWLS
jgi:hypothetical protein